MYNIKHFNFFSLDVEGAELQVLEGMDLSCVSFDVIVVEACREGCVTVGSVDRDSAVRLLLEKHGYKYHGHASRNDWFIRPGFVPSRKPVPDTP